AVGYRFAFEPPFADEGTATHLDFCSRGGVDHVVVVGRDLLMQALGCMNEQVAVLVNRAALGRHVAPEGGQCLLQPVPPSTIRNSGLRSPRLTRSSRTARHAALVSPPMFLAANSTFWPSSRTPSTTRSTIAVAFRSSRTRTTVPSRIRRMIGSAANERAFQASQSPFTFRHTRLTVSLRAGRGSAALGAR